MRRFIVLACAACGCLTISDPVQSDPSPGPSVPKLLGVQFSITESTSSGLSWTTCGWDTQGGVDPDSNVIERNWAVESELTIEYIVRFSGCGGDSCGWFASPNCQPTGTPCPDVDFTIEAVDSTHWTTSSPQSFHGQASTAALRAIAPGAGGLVVTVQGSKYQLDLNAVAPAGLKLVKEGPNSNDDGDAIDSLSIASTAWVSPRLIGPDGGHLCGNPPLSLTATGVRAGPDPKANSGSVANEPFMVTPGSAPGYIEFATAGFWLTLPVCVGGNCPAACPTCGAGEACVDGKCEACSCGQRACGVDQCGRTCGTCPDSKACDPASGSCS